MVEVFVLSAFRKARERSDVPVEVPGPPTSRHPCLTVSKRRWAVEESGLESDPDLQSKIAAYVDSGYLTLRSVRQGKLHYDVSGTIADYVHGLILREARDRKSGS